jgi:hypothetical protein
MGDIADMILDGTLCQVCGVHMIGNGYPQTCQDCGGDCAGVPIKTKRKKRSAKQSGKKAAKIKNDQR